MVVFVQLFLCDIPARTKLEWRNALMKMFIQGIDEDMHNFISGGGGFKNICHGWMGITCAGEEVVDVSYLNFQNHGSFNISCLPPSTKVILINSSTQEFELNTRSLPKKLEVLELKDNLIFGRLSLRTLPSGIRYINLSTNRLTGPISITGLPNGFKSLNILANPICQTTVFYDNIPDSLYAVVFPVRQRGEFSSGVNEVRSLNPSQKVVNKKIFVNVKHIN